MLHLRITDIRKFTELLFTRDTFDRFLLHDASFYTACTYSVEGEINKEYFGEDEKEAPANSFISWEEIRPLAMKIIAGKKLPLSFRIVLLTDRKSTDAMVMGSGFTGCPVTSLSMNIVYKNSELTLTTGVSYNGFSMDKSLENYWDENLTRFLNRKECAFETM